MPRQQLGKGPGSTTISGRVTNGIASNGDAFSSGLLLITHDTQRTWALMQKCKWHSKLMTLRSLGDAVELELNVEVMLENVALAKN